MKKYQAIIFDLFDTLVHFHLGSLATKEGVLDIKQLIEQSYQVFHRYYPAIELEAFYPALQSIYQEIMRERERDLREIPAETRFRRLLDRLGIAVDGDAQAPLKELVEDHMQTIQQVSVLPPEHYDLLHTLSKSYVLGLVSNFDHAATLFAIMERFGIRELFRKVVVSVEIGVRKPHPDIFLTVLEGLGVEAKDALFVGDDQKADLLGAKKLGMAVAWLNRKGKALQEGIPQPDYEIGSLRELLGIL